MGKRGGYRIKQNYKSSQSRLLDALWEKHGGLSAVGELIGVSATSIGLWRHTGWVPPEYIKTLSKALGELIWAFNFEFLAELFPSVPRWDKVIKSCNFLESTNEKILKGTFPKGAV